MAERASKWEVEERVRHIADLLCQNKTYMEVQSECQQAYGVTGRQIDTYIGRAREYLRETVGSQNREELLSKHLAMRKHLYKLALDKKDYRTAAQLLRDQADLEGLYVQRVELTGKGEVAVSELSDDDLEKALEG